MAERLPGALDRALEKVNALGPDASFEEALHELGVSTREGVALVGELRRNTDGELEAVTAALYVGILIGRELRREGDRPDR